MNKKTTVNQTRDEAEVVGKHRVIVFVCVSYFVIVGFCVFVCLFCVLVCLFCSLVCLSASVQGVTLACTGS